MSKDDSLLTMVALQDVVFENMQESYTSIDAMQSILRSKGIRVKNDDPIFTLLTLNSLLLDESKSKLRLNSTRQKIKLVLAPTVAIAATAFVFGMFFGTPNTVLSPIFITVFAIILGAVLGATGLLICRREDNNIVQNQEAAGTPSSPEWTEQELYSVSLLTNIDQRLKDACRDVLIGKLEISTAAKKYQIFSAQIERAIGKLNNNR